MAHDRRSLPDLNFGPKFTKIRWARRPTRIARTLWLEDFNLRGGGGAVIIRTTGIVYFFYLYTIPRVPLPPGEAPLRGTDTNVHSRSSHAPASDHTYED